MSATAAYARDANRVPITTDGLTTIESHTLVGSNATSLFLFLRLRELLRFVHCGELLQQY